MAEIRQELQPYLKKRIQVSGLYSKSDLWTDPHTCRQFKVVCLARVEDETGNQLAEHVWIHHANNIMEEKPDTFERIKLSAVVCEHTKDGQKNYFLDVPDDIEFPDRETIAFRPQRPQPAPVPELKSVQPQPAPDPFSLLLKLNSLAEKVGSLDELQQWISRLPILEELRSFAVEVGGFDRLQKMVETLKALR